MTTATLDPTTTTTVTPAEPAPPTWTLPRKHHRVEVDSHRKTCTLTFRTEDELGPIYRQATAEAEAALQRELRARVTMLPAHDELASLRLRLRAGEQHATETRGQLERAKARKSDLVSDKSLAGGKLADALSKADVQVKDLSERLPAAEAAVLSLKEETTAAEARLRQQAEAGDTAAAKLLLLYTLGRPAETTDPDRLDLGEWELLAAQPSLAAVLRTLGDRADPANAAALVGNDRPKDQREFLERFFDRAGEKRHLMEVLRLSQEE